jgi:cytoskeletal protein RodZ
VRVVVDGNLHDHNQVSFSVENPIHGATLAGVLSAAREARAVTLGEASEQIHVPVKYLKMLESSNYSSICDELYLLPYLRAYSEFLDLDADQMAIRFVNEVQRTEVSGPPLPEIKEERSGVRGSWVTTVAVVFFVALALYLATLR